jgi:hypothetical protein
MLAYSAGLRAPLVAGAPAAPLAGNSDPLAWHVMGILGSQEMRRCRRIDVVKGDDVSINAMFRDTYLDSNGAERVLHQYSVTARAELATLALTHIEAVPHTLPHVECPEAAASALAARGVHLPMLRNVVEQTLYGPASCTHLNDLLRSLADAGNLAALVAGPAAG